MTDGVHDLRLRAVLERDELRVLDMDDGDGPVRVVDRLQLLETERVASAFPRLLSAELLDLCLIFLPFANLCQT